MNSTKMGIPLYNVKSIADYWITHRKYLESLVSVLLQNKHEYGTSKMCSEAGIQRSLVRSAERIAQKCGFDIEKTGCICLSVGLCFPDFGLCGMTACENYIRQKQYPWKINELKIGAIENCLYMNGLIVTPELDEALHSYYENQTNIPEVNIVRYCQMQILKARNLMQTGIPAGKAITEIMSIAENEYSTEKSIMVVGDTDSDVPLEVQCRINQLLDEFIEFDGVPQGILEVIA